MSKRNLDGIGADNKRIFLKFKRLFDIIVSLLILLITSPFLIIAMIIIKAEHPKGKVIFRQKRIGKNSRVFIIYKLRTMKTDTPNLSSADLAQRSGEYVTSVGKFLRKSSIDELPQLFNVLKGDMSLVGPRPLITSEKEVHSLRNKYGVYTVAPGITGLAQISGRDLIENEEKVKLDAEYVKNISMWLDLKILFKTIFAVFFASGVVEGKHK